MAELIDISNDKFWDILFDEACVEGQQAERIEKALKQISTTEAEIRENAISEFAEKLKAELRDSIIPDEQKFQYERKTQERICVQNVAFKIIIKLVEQLVEQLREE